VVNIAKKTDVLRNECDSDKIVDFDLDKDVSVKACPESVPKLQRMKAMLDADKEQNPKVAGEKPTEPKK